MTANLLSRCYYDVIWLFPRFLSAPLSFFLRDNTAVGAGRRGAPRGVQIRTGAIIKNSKRAARTASAKQSSRRQRAAERLRNINEYTLGEEVANSVTHGVGALLAVAALTLLIVAAQRNGGGLRLAAAIIFGVTLVLEYINSTLYHAFPSPKVKRVFKILDHSSIYLLIAGTYTPFTLVTFADSGGPWMTVLIWTLAVVGVALEAFWVFRPRWLGALIYLGMGWIIIWRINVLLELLPLTGVILLVAGGICYSLGIIFYVMKKVRYMHFIWHLWVLAGSVLHFLSILLYVL